MTGQKLFRMIQEHACHEEPVDIGALHGHSGNNQDISAFSHTKVEKDYAPYLYHIGF